MIIDIDFKQETLMCKSVLEIIALFLNFPSLDQCPCYLLKTRIKSNIYEKHEWIHRMDSRGICTAEAIA